jgi:hypothetical protein
MKRIRRILRALVRHPRTSAAGITALIAFGYGLAHDPAVLTDTETWVAVLAAIGLLLAADSGNTPGGGATGELKPPAKVLPLPGGLRCA